MMARMSDADFYHQYRWALERLAEAFGPDNVTPRKPAGQGQVLAVEIRGPQSERAPYLLFFKDHLLLDVNKHSQPGLFLDKEIRAARAWFEGKSQRGTTIP